MSVEYKYINIVLFYDPFSHLKLGVTDYSLIGEINYGKYIFLSSI